LEKVYKSRIYRIIFNLLCGAALSFFVFYIAQIWLTQLTSIIITSLIFLSYIWLVIWGNFITIIVNDKELIVKNGKKEDNMFNKIVNYCKTSYDELAHKTTWPTRAELTHSAMVVLSASLIIALMVFCMDSVFKFVMGAIYPN